MEEKINLRKIDQSEFDKIYSEHQEWLKNSLSEKKQGNLSNVDLTEVSFLNKANFSNFIFIGADLNNVEFENIDFSYADFSHSNLENTSFNNVNLESSNLANANLNTSLIRNSKLLSSNLSNSNFANSYFYNVDLKYSKLENANFENAILLVVDLRKVYFNNSNFKNLSYYKLDLDKKLKNFIHKFDLRDNSAFLENRLNKLRFELNSFDGEKNQNSIQGNAASINKLGNEIQIIEEKINFDDKLLDVNHERLSFTQRLLSLLKSIKFWTIAGPIITFIALFPSIIGLIHDIQKDREQKNKVINFTIADYPIENEEFVSFIYLMPDTITKIFESSAYFPIKITNKNRTLEDLYFEIQYDYYQQGNERVIKKENDLERKYFIQNKSIQNKAEIIKCNIGNLNPFMQYEDNEYFRINLNPKTNPHYEVFGGVTSKPETKTMIDWGYIDAFVTNYFMTFKDAEKPYIVRVAVSILKANSVDDFLNKVEDEGMGITIPLTYTNPETSDIIFPNKTFLVNNLFIPMENKSVILPDFSSFVRIEYKPETFFKKRTIFFYDNQDKIVFERKFENFVGDKKLREKDIIRQIKNSSKEFY